MDYTLGIGVVFLLKEAHLQCLRLRKKLRRKQISGKERENRFPPFEPGAAYWLGLSYFKLVTIMNL